MNLFENYNTAKQKYGETLVSKLLNTQIPDEYLLSACRFYNEGVKENDLKNYFKQWAIYVKRNNTKIDVNKLSFAQFYQTIQEYKQQYGITNKVYDDGMVSIGRINSAKDIAKFPVKNDWCIKQPSMFQKYIDQGYSFYIIDNGNESNYIRYVILMISKDSAKYYYDLENEKMTQDSIAEFQSYLTQDAISFIQNLNENKEYKTNKNMTKNKIRITENKLKRIITESVKKILNEHISTNDYISIYDDNYEEIIPLYDIFKHGFTFDEYHREKILLDTSLCDKDGRELGVCLNDLCLKYKPNKK